MKKSLCTFTSVCLLMMSSAAYADPQKCVTEIDKRAKDAGETVEAKAVCDCIYDRAASHTEVQAEIVNSEGFPPQDGMSDKLKKIVKECKANPSAS